MRVILVNPTAASLRARPDRIKRIRELCEGWAHVVVSASARDGKRQLEVLDRKERIQLIVVAGGDGTFHMALNWAMRQPADRRPALCSVGGGQFCYMMRFCGFRSRDPVKNIEIVRRCASVREESWRPLVVHDSLTRSKRYGAVFGTGLLPDFIRWYNADGKGGIAKVTWLIVLAALSLAWRPRWMERAVPRFGQAFGQVTFDAFVVPRQEYTAVLVGAMNEFLPKCTPFRGQPSESQCYAAGYWGSLILLASGIVPLWFGRVAPWLASAMHNAPSNVVTITTREQTIMMDGDVIQPDDPSLNGQGSHNPPVRTFTIMRASPIGMMRRI